MLIEGLTAALLSGATQLHLGAHVGTSSGRASFAGADPLPLHREFDASGGTGSYDLGLRLGVDREAGHLVLGLEGEVDAPNTVGGPRDSLLVASSLRGRLGIHAGRTIAYVTAGPAWARDRLSRSGIAAGAGVDVPLTGPWAARWEYLHETFDRGDLELDTFRLALNYRYPAGARALPSPLETSRFAFHGQTTLVAQYALPFDAPYAGRNSLAPDQVRETLDFTFYLGWHPWHGGELWFNPEIDQGFGLSSTVGAAGFPSAEAYKVGADYPYARFHRYFLRQTFDLGGPPRKQDSDLDQFPLPQTTDRLVLTAGKFSAGDIFDLNRLAHDPRQDFLNWSAVDTGTFDYAADAWAFTYGLTAEYITADWAARAGFLDLPVQPNSTDLDTTFAQHQWVVELEHRHQARTHPGRVAVTAFESRARMGRFDDALALARASGAAPDTALVRRDDTARGVALNLDQELSADVSAFLRTGVRDGGVEPFAFTDVDRTLGAGLTINGRGWRRPKDTFGAAAIVNDVSAAHRAYFDAGGLGILAGDGRLARPGPERVAEVYYARPLSGMRATIDLQRIENPAYNRDRGPVTVLGVRLHDQF